MLKKKKYNENNIKKDFFSKKKKVSYIDFVSFTERVSFSGMYVVDKLSQIDVLPDIGCMIIITTLKNSPTAEIIQNLNVSDVYLSCNAINQKQLSALSNKGLKSIIARNTMKDKFDEFHFSCNVIFKDNHTKILAFKHKDQFFVLEGSGNPSINARNEIYTLTNSSAKYNEILNFHNHA